MTTAERFFRDGLVQSSIDENGNYSLYDIEEAMMGFARLHVQEALKQAAEKHDAKLYIKGTYKGARWIEFKEGMEYNPMETSIMTKTDKKSILTAYPLSNII